MTSPTTPPPGVLAPPPAPTTGAGPAVPAVKPVARPTPGPSPTRLTPLSLGPVVVIAVLTLALGGLLLIGLLPWPWGLLAALGLVALVIMLWWLVRRGLKALARRGGRPGAMAGRILGNSRHRPGLGSRSGPLGRILGGTRGSGPSSGGRPRGPLSALRSRLPRVLGGTRPTGRSGQPGAAGSRRPGAAPGSGGRGPSTSSSGRRPWWPSRRDRGGAGGPSPTATGRRPGGSTGNTPGARTKPRTGFWQGFRQGWRNGGKPKPATPASKPKGTQAGNGQSTLKPTPPAPKPAPPKPPAGPTPSGGAAPPIPVPTGGGGGSTSTPAPVIGGDVEFRSVHTFGRTVRKATEPIAEVRAYVHQLATAAETQPVRAGVRDSLRAAVAALNAAESQVAQAYSGYRSGNARDIDRAENPRGGSVGVEAKADVDRAHREA